LENLHVQGSINFLVIIQLVLLSLEILAMPGSTEVHKLEEEVKRLRSHLESISNCDQKFCGEEFRKHVSGAREPFHSTHDETNQWTESNDKGCQAGGCTIC
jgi:hypothetical protein